MIIGELRDAFIGDFRDRDPELTFSQREDFERDDIERIPAGFFAMALLQQCHTLDLADRVQEEPLPDLIGTRKPGLLLLPLPEQGIAFSLQLALLLEILDHEAKDEHARGIGKDHRDRDP